MEPWDALTGLGTMALAIATFVVIKQSIALRKDDERHHQEQFRPVCILIRPHFSDPRGLGNQLLVVDTNIKINMNIGLLSVRCSLTNIGPGAALNVRISIRLPNLCGLQLNKYEIAPLAAGQTFNPKGDFNMPIELSDRFNSTDFASLEGQVWEIIVEYDDIFGNTFYSIHRKPPAQPWVSIGKAPI